MDGLDWLHEQRPTIPKQVHAKPVRFRDLNPDYSQDSLPIIIEEETAIKARIRLVLSTLIGSDDFLPTFGSNLPLRLYEPITDNTAYLLELDTFIALSDWIDEIVIGANTTFIPLSNEEGYRIDIPFIIKTSGKQVLYSFDVLR